MTRARPTRTLAGLLRRLPWWVAAVLGVVCVALGVAVTARPFDSLRVLVLAVAASFVVTGGTELVAARTAPSPRLNSLAGAVWTIAGVAVLVWPGITISALAILAGISMLAGGVIKLGSGLRGAADDRLAAALSGLASVIFGGLALVWPDVTVLVLALLVGPATILFGIGQVAAALARRPSRLAERASSEVSGSRRRSRWLRVAGAGTVLTAALGLAGISAWLRAGESGVDAFYDPPEAVTSTPGILLRSEVFRRDIPEGARAWRILYTTTRDDGLPAVASAIIVAPASPPDNPRPVIAWNHGTTGYDRTCAPSVLSGGLSTGALPALAEVIANGWVLVATDYVGLGTRGPHPYLVGQGQARSALDAVRAAHQFDELSLDDQTVVWGHSQGGHAALWAGMLGPSYAPDVNLAGVVAMAPAADLVSLAGHLTEGVIGATLSSYLITAYSQIYPDVALNDYVRPGARTFVRQTASRCLSEPSALVSVVGALPFDGPIVSRDPTSGPLGARLAENIPDGPIEAPLMIAQGASDSLILSGVQDQFVEQRCAAGQRLEYRLYDGRNHISLIEDDSPLVPDLIDWTTERFAGIPQEAGCRTVTE